MADTEVRPPAMPIRGGASRKFAASWFWMRHGRPPVRQVASLVDFAEESRGRIHLSRCNQLCRTYASCQALVNAQRLATWRAFVSPLNSGDIIGGLKEASLVAD